MKSIKSVLCTLVLALSMGVMSMTAFAATVEGTATSDINVRATANAKGTLLGKIKKGTKVTIIAKETGWYKIKQTVKPTIGYVSADYMKVTKGSVSDIGSTDDSEDEDVPDESGEEILIDDEGSDEDVIILDEEGVDVLPDESEDGIIEEDGDVPDEAAGDEDVPDESEDGDVPDESQDDVPDESGSGSSFKISPKTLYAKSNVTIRSKPSTSGAKKGTLNKGESMTAVEYIKSGATYNGSKVKGNWYRSNKGNFVSADFLTTSKPSASSAGGSSSSSSTGGSTSGSGSYTATKTATKYSSPLTLATKKGTINSGSSVTVKKTYKDGSLYKTMKVSGTWYELSDGTFVQSSSLKKS